MIASLSGTIAHLANGVIVIEVGGVGIAVQCGAPVIRGLQVGQHVALSTSLVVREDSLTLYGFIDADHRDVFETLQSVSGVGPRVALGVLSVLTPNQLRSAVHRGDEATLTRAPGIGRKGAQRMVLELSDKLTPPIQPSIDVRDHSEVDEDSTGFDWQVQVREALISLGWTSREADGAIAFVIADPASAGPGAGVSSGAHV